VFASTGLYPRIRGIPNGTHGSNGPRVSRIKTGINHRVIESTEMKTNTERKTGHQNKGLFSVLVFISVLSVALWLIRLSPLSDPLDPRFIRETRVPSLRCLPSDRYGRHAPAEFSLPRRLLLDSASCRGRWRLRTRATHHGGYHAASVHRGSVGDHRRGWPGGSRLAAKPSPGADRHQRHIRQGFVGWRVGHRCATPAVSHQGGYESSRRQHPPHGVVRSPNLGAHALQHDDLRSDPRTLWEIDVSQLNWVLTRCAVGSVGRGRGLTI